MRLLTSIFFALFSFFTLTAQNNQYANDNISPYMELFRYGSNIGYNPPWKDKQLADIAAGNEELGIEGAGVNSFRPSLPERFLEQWGYDVRLDEFQHYDALGLKENVLFVGYPSDEHKDPMRYCEGEQSELFANMYTDIWDNGENGTPINDDNYYALYLYKLVQLYGDYVKFYEVWNEPEFSWSPNSWADRGEPGNWFDNDPDPCDMAIKAPVYHYVRMLRISYEVLKTYDPDAYICVGGLGYESFLDAVVRNTDNPTDGSRTGLYPLTGGAYFDVVSYHTYPHINGSLRHWDNDIDDFVYYRHSDAAVKGLIDHKDRFEEVMFEYGYDGITYPEKMWIITEANMPRRTFDDRYFGTEMSQVNFLIKALVECQLNDISQFHVYNLAEKKSEEEAESAFDLFGLYKKLRDSEPYTQVINNGGIAYKTTSDILFGSRYHPAQTNWMNLPEGVKGGAFYNEDTEEFTYVLWAMTDTDKSEEASAIFEFPDQENFTIEQMKWDYSQTANIEILDVDKINLTATPVFIKLTPAEDSGTTTSTSYLQYKAEVNCYPNPINQLTKLSFELNEASNVSVSLFNLQGQRINTIIESTELPVGKHEVDLFQDSLTPGVYFCRLELNGQSVTKKLIRL